MPEAECHRGGRARGMTGNGGGDLCQSGGWGGGVGGRRCLKEREQERGRETAEEGTLGPIILRVCLGAGWGWKLAYDEGPGVEKAGMETIFLFQGSWWQKERIPESVVARCGQGEGTTLCSNGELEHVCVRKSSTSKEGRRGERD